MRGAKSEQKILAMAKKLKLWQTAGFIGAAGAAGKKLEVIM